MVCEKGTGGCMVFLNELEGRFLSKARFCHQSESNRYKSEILEAAVAEVSQGYRLSHLGPFAKFVNEFGSL